MRGAIVEQRAQGIPNFSFFGSSFGRSGKPGVRCSARSARAAKDGGRMLSRGVGALSGLRWGIFSLTTALTVLAVSSDTSDARSRRKHVEPSETSHSEAASEDPRYSDTVVE